MEITHYTVKIQPAAEGGYWAEVPALPGCFSRGDTLEEATASVRAAIEFHLASLQQRGEPWPVEKLGHKTFTFPILVRAA